MDIKELRNRIDDISIGYDYEETYAELWKTMVDYWNEHQQWFGEERFYDYLSYFEAEEMAKHELESGGLLRLWYFMGDVNFGCCDLLKLDAYGNLTEADADDLEMLKAELLEDIEQEIELMAEAE